MASYSKNGERERFKRDDAKRKVSKGTKPHRTAMALRPHRRVKH